MSDPDQVRRLQSLANQVRGFQGGRAVVVGDIVLDHHVSGIVDKLDSAAPIPTMVAHSEVTLLGASAHVALSFSRLGLDTNLVTVVGDDDDGQEVFRQFNAAGLSTEAIVTCVGRTTTRITRHHGRRLEGQVDSQLLFRLERSQEGDVDASERESLISKTKHFLDSTDILVISDYGRGVVDDELLLAALRKAKDAGITTIVDPKLTRLTATSGADIVIFERRGLELLAKRREQVSSRLAAQELLSEFNWGGLLEIRGVDGVAFHRRGESLQEVQGGLVRAEQSLGLHDAAAAALAISKMLDFDTDETLITVNAACELILSRKGQRELTLDRDALAERINELAWDLRISQR
ncbi:MAG TPA: PfkB family carbohydrate kinase [Candidatus Poseidoniales archaeon]|nr:PfkB family carbohydrate kinase [Candidatus Poseidoniales archaeon]